MHTLFIHFRVGVLSGNQTGAAGRAKDLLYLPSYSPTVDAAERTTVHGVNSSKLG